MWQRSVYYLISFLALTLAACIAPVTPLPAAQTPTVAVAQRNQPLPLHDAHIHYGADSVTTYSLDQVVAILDGAGIQRMLVSSTPNDGTVSLFERLPGRVVPELRPYRTRADLDSWFNDPAIVEYVTQEFGRGIYRSIGEFHADGDEAKTPVVQSLVGLAVQHGVPLHAHSDAAAIAALFTHDANVRVIWAHAGMSEPVATVRQMVERYPNLWVELSYRYDIAPNNQLDPAWRDLFLDHPDRFLYGTDTWVPSRWQELPNLVTRARGWLEQLPPEVAVKIATENFAALFPE